MNVSPRLRAILLTAILSVIAFDVAFAWQRLAKAHLSEFRGTPSEASHYLSGLALRDYAKSGMDEPIGKYLEKYEWHYSAVNVRASPIFHLLEAAWMLVMGTGRVSVLLFLATLAGIFAIVVFRCLSDEVHTGWAFAGTVAMLCLPAVQQAYLNVEPTLLSATFLFGALLAYKRFMETGRWLWALVYPLCAALAVATGVHVLVIVALLLLPPVLSADWALLRRPGFWAVLGGAALLIGVYLWVAGAEQARGVTGFASRSRDELLESASGFRYSTGPVLLIFAIYGVLVILRNKASRSRYWSGCASIVIASLLVLAFGKPTVANSHLLFSVVGVLMFATAGVSSFVAPKTSEEAPQTKRSVLKPALAAAVFVIGIGALVLPVQEKEFRGFGAIAVEVVRAMKPGQTVFVSSDDAGEGAFSAEIAMRDPSRPSIAVHRAGHMLQAGTSAAIAENRPYENEDQVLSFLQRTNVRYLVQDESLMEGERSKHYNLVRQTVHQNGGNFLRQAHAESMRHGEETSAGIVMYLVDNLRRD